VYLLKNAGAGTANGSGSSWPNARPRLRGKKGVGWGGAKGWRGDDGMLGGNSRMKRTKRSKNRNEREPG
jgi:hypothetical protein